MSQSLAHVVIPAPPVIPAKAGIQNSKAPNLELATRRKHYQPQASANARKRCPWIPACAGMTRRRFVSPANKVSQPVGAGDTPSAINQAAGVLL